MFGVGVPRVFLVGLFLVDCSTLLSLVIPSESVYSVKGKNPEEG